MFADTSGLHAANEVLRNGVLLRQSAAPQYATTGLYVWDFGGFLRGCRGLPGGGEGGELHRFFVSDVDVGVDMRSASEVPDKRRPFDSPAVPDFVGKKIALLVEGHAHLVNAA